MPAVASDNPGGGTDGGGCDGVAAGVDAFASYPFVNSVLDPANPADVPDGYGEAAEGVDIPANPDEFDGPNGGVGAAAGE